MKRILLSALMIAMLITAGCTQQTGETNGGEGDTQSTSIGFIGPLSGDQAIIGTENFRGAELAVDEVNARGGISGTQISLLTQDDQFNEKETLDAYSKLVNTDGVRYMLTATYGGFLALADRVQQDQTLLIESLDTSEELAGVSDNQFAVGIYDESIGFTIADFLNANDAKTVGALILQDPFTSLVEGAMKDRFRGEMHIEHYTPDTRDYRTALTKLASNNYLVVIGWEEAGRAVRQARELGIDATIIGIDTMSSEGFRSNTNNNYDGLHFTFWEGAKDNQRYQHLLEAYRKRYGQEPENVLFLATGYDAAHILLQSMQGCNEKIGCIRENLRNVRGYQGATGVVNIDEDHITRSIRETIHQYSGNEIVPAR